jgi:hypothetical protein
MRAEYVSAVSEPSIPPEKLLLITPTRTSPSEHCKIIEIVRNLFIDLVIGVGIGS